MHMADALVSPAVGGTMMAVTAGLGLYSTRRISKINDSSKIPLMGALGAFVFAAQMVNFSIPGTGSSGHLAGGLLLAILLGPQAGFLTIASVLVIQAMFFMDGGLLALGCNIFNMGAFACFIAYPLIYHPIAGTAQSRNRITAGAMVASIIALQLGAFAVVCETWLSGISTLPFSKFLLLMQPIHLAIGIVEGIVTAAIVVFVWQVRPELFKEQSVSRRSFRGIATAFIIVAVIVGAGLSWFASSHPDGLEWSIFHASGSDEVATAQDSIHATLAKVQERLSFMPDYDFADTKGKSAEPGSWPQVKSGTSIAGLVGGTMTLVLVVVLGFAFRASKRKT